MNFFRNARVIETYPAGTDICRKGDGGDVMFAIVKGTVEIMVQEKAIATLGVGEFFGEMALIDQSVRSATARAKTDCRVALIDEQQFLNMVQESPLFALEVMRVLAERLRGRLEHP